MNREETMRYVALEVAVGVLIDLIVDLADESPCQFDHNGTCQEHFWTLLPDGLTCPHGRAQKLIAARSTEVPA